MADTTIEKSTGAETPSAAAAAPAMAATPASSSPTATKPKKKKFNKRRLIKPLIWVGIIVLLVIVIAALVNGARNNMKGADEEIYTVTRQDLQVSITGSGVMKPIDQREVVSLISKGTILTAPFEENDVIQEGTLLYTFDRESLENDIEKTKNSIRLSEIEEQSLRETMSDWTVTANASGYITNFKTTTGSNFHTGDSINAGVKLCEINNEEVLHINIPFSETQKSSIYVGQSAQLSSAQYMTSGLYGTVSKVSDAPIYSNDGTETLYNIEIALPNPGAVASGMEFTATIGGMMSPASGVTQMSANDPVSSRESGKISAIYVSEGDYVRPGTPIMRLTNSAVTDAIEKNAINRANLQLTLESQLKQLEDYSITAPISGTVIKKNSKAGDNLSAGATAAVLAAIADTSRMKFTMEIDELDIRKIKLGQEVAVTADATDEEGLVFLGIVTQIMPEGVSTNGVTVFYVEVTIDEPGELGIGMNVNATVVVEDKAAVVQIPIEALIKDKGKTYVRVAESAPTQAPSISPYATPSATPFAMPSSTPDAEPVSPPVYKDRNGNVMPGEMREVVTGVSNRDFIEILSGINEGDKIYIPNVGGSSALEGMMGGGNSPMGGNFGGGGSSSSGGDGPTVRVRE